MTTSTTVKRSSVPDIRERMLEKGALLFKFIRPDNVELKDKHIEWFNNMQEVGFLVTTSGCILPYENFRTSSKKRPKGHKISAYYFFGTPPVYEDHQYGWPIATQTSHRCHRKNCINPTHIIYEPQWKNLKRNYCGDSGECDCNVEPICLAPYRSGDWVYEDDFISYSTDGYKQLVAEHLTGFRYTILPENHYASADKKKKDRNQRLQNKRKASPSVNSPSKKKK